jgi:hypothetical protein
VTTYSSHRIKFFFYFHFFEKAKSIEERYFSVIILDNKRKELGRFKNAKDAALARDKHILKLCLGDLEKLRFKLNFPKKKVAVSILID